MKEDENSWVFDSLVAFLNGPIWSAPLDSFIEEKSLIFEPNIPENEEYKVIFDEFKNLVDFMLGNFMEDIGITPEQFEEACNKGHRYSIHFDQNLFEQIWAANDYEMFKRLMTQKNVELQLQALELIERKFGKTPDSFIPQKKKGNKDETVSEAKQEENQSSLLEQEVMKEVEKTFSKEVTTSSEEIQTILEEKPVLEETLKKEKEKTVKFQTEHIEEIPTYQDDKCEEADDQKPVEETKEPETEPEKATLAEISYDKRPINAEIDSKELKKRQEYLKAQRDKLVALKKEARKKHLDIEHDPKSKSKSRPKSAKAAETVMAGESKIEPQQLQIRKALAERLRAEVVSKKQT